MKEKNPCLGGPAVHQDEAEAASGQGGFFTQRIKSFYKLQVQKY